MNSETQIKLVQKLKTLVIKNQMYESAAILRDMERKLIKSLIDYSTNYEWNITNIDEYNYLIDLTLKLQGKEYKGIERYEKIRDQLKSECLPIIREEKLNQLFKD
jgi:hypothetical protein